MADSAGGVSDQPARRPMGREAPASLGGRLRQVGPGLVVAATGVGAGDMVSSLSAGTAYGTTLIWAIVIGALLKYVLTEGIGRWYMATGETILEGWHSLGRWASTYFVVYLFLVTLVFGAAVTSASALATTAMFPDVMPLWTWAALHGVFGFVVVAVGRYALFERIMEVFVALMFVTVVGLAVLLAPDVGELVSGTVVPALPEGSLLYAIAVIGGVGGTFTLASYTYWVRERGWRRPSWIPTMRADLGAGYFATGLFMVAMLVVGAELLFASGESIGEEAGLVALSDPIEQRFGAVASWLFLLGFWSATTSSILGAWNGGAYLFADFMRTLRRVPDERSEEFREERVLQGLRGLDHLPSDAPARLRRARHAGDRLRRSRGAVHAVPGRHAAVAAELQACGRRVPQRDRGQRPAGHLGVVVHRRRGAGGRGHPVTDQPTVRAVD